MASDDESSGRPSHGQPGTRVVAWLLAPGVAAVALFTLLNGSWADLGVASMVALAAFALGASLGFLFGIPRTLASGGRGQQRAAGAGNGAQDAHEDDGKPRYQPNTNLEDISDWLTKILVGAGLVGLTRAVDAVGRLADRISVALGGRAGESSPEWAFALGLLVAFAVSGFLAGYLYTRLRLQWSFARADDVNELKSELRSEVIRAVDEQRKTDAEALALVGRQLNPNDAHPSERELDAAVAAASDGTRKQIFNFARSQRRASWQTNKTKLELTIPVFHGLIVADSEDRFFRNHGEMGFALFDREPPDYAGAAASLDKAIELRDRQGVAGFQRYDWIRAEARMRVPAGDPEANARQILADLGRAATDPEVAALMREQPSIRAWCAANGVALDDVIPAGPEPGPAVPEPPLPPPPST